MSENSWTTLADRVAKHVESYLTMLEAIARGDAKEQTVPMLLLEVSQIAVAGAQLGANTDVILPDNWEPDENV